MTISVNIHEAKAKLSHLLAKVQQGEEVIICNRNAPAARLVPVEKKPKEKRRLGLYKGKVKIHDSFFEPLTEEELGMSFEGIFPDAK